MGQVLRLPRPRRPKVKWSGGHIGGRVEILVQWHDREKAVCAIHVMSMEEWRQLQEPKLYFWSLIERLRDKAQQCGARF